MNHLEQQGRLAAPTEDPELTGRRDHERTSARRRVTAAMVFAFVTAFPLGFTWVMWLDVPAECRLWNTGSAVDSCISGERDGLWWMSQVTGIAIVGLMVLAVVGLVALDGVRSVAMLIGSVAATGVMNVWLSRGLTYDQLTGTGLGFVAAYLPTTTLVIGLTLRWVPLAIVDGDRSALLAWVDLLAAAGGSLAIGSVLGVREQLLWWFGPIVGVAMVMAAALAARTDEAEHRARWRRLTAILVPAGCALGLTVSVVVG